MTQIDTFVARQSTLANMLRIADLGDLKRIEMVVALVGIHGDVILAIQATDPKSGDQK